MCSYITIGSGPKEVLRLQVIIYRLFSLVGRRVIFDIKATRDYAVKPRIACFLSIVPELISKTNILLNSAGLTGR